MAAQRGKDVLIKLGDGASPEVFTSLAGLRTKNLTINNEFVDITSSDSTGEWREGLAAAGVRSFSISGSGVFKDAAIDTTIKDAIVAGSVDNWQIIIPGFGTFAGSFLITQLSYAGEYNGAATYDISLESTGALTFTAA